MQKNNINNYLTPLTMKPNFITHRKGFTLVELIIVIAIIAVLASLAFMSMSSETGNARDSSRKQDISTFENAIATSNSKNRPINFGTATTLTTTAGVLNTLRGAKIVEIDETVFEPTILQKISQDPSKNKYIGVFLNENMYQLFATLENPDTGTSTALLGGTFKEGVILDTLAADMALAATEITVNDASKFLEADTLTVGTEDFIIAAGGVNATTNVLTVTVAATVKHLKGSQVKLKTFPKGVDTTPANSIDDSSGKSLLCVGTLVQLDGATAPASAPADAYCDEGQVIINGSQTVPYSL